MLIVAIHDVAPSELSEVRWLLGQLDTLGVSRRVLKVIPAAPGDGDPAEMLALLHDEVANGSEVVIHGWTHTAAGALRGSLPDRIRGRLFAGNAAEFLSLDDAEVGRRIAAGREWLSENGLIATGFCPPGWLATAAVTSALRQAGYRYEVTLRGLRDLDRGRWVVLPPVGYMGAGPGQERLIRLGAALLSRPLRRMLGVEVHRFFLHPQGASRSNDCRRVLEEIGNLARRHQAASYGELAHA